MTARVAMTAFTINYFKQFKQLSGCFYWFSYTYSMNQGGEKAPRDPSYLNKTTIIAWFLPNSAFIHQCHVIDLIQRFILSVHETNTKISGFSEAQFTDMYIAWTYSLVLFTSTGHSNQSVP